MTASQTVVCLLQQMQATGVVVTSVSPLTVAGRAEDVLRFRAVVGYLRDRAAQHGTEHGKTIDIDSLIANLSTDTGLIRWEKLTGTPWSTVEDDLSAHIGEFVWLNDNVFVFGRLEGVMPGIALVSPRPHPCLPVDPVAAFRTRTDGALPFALAIVEPEHSATSREERAVNE